MKTLLLSFALLLCAQFSSAQLIASTALDTPTKKMYEVKIDSEEEALQALIAKRHTQAAEKQIANYLLMKLDYSESMKDYAIEGDLVLDVSLNEKGELISHEVLTSPHTLLTENVNRVLAGLDKISIKNQDYRGTTNIKIPVAFSLK